MTSPFCLAFVGSTQARPAMLITTLLAVLTIMASVTSLEAQYTPVTTVQRALTTGAWMTQRCKNRPIDQFQIPNNNLGNVNYTIGFRSSSGGATTNLAVPGDLLINDFDVASWTTTNQVARTLEVRPSILAELCSELPYLLYRSWPSTTTLSRNTNDLFKVAADGCELLVAAFGSADHAHMTSTISQAPSNSLRVIASSIVQVLATNGGGGNLGDNPFQDRRSIFSVPVVSQARSKISRSARTIQARSSARWGVLTAVQPFTHFADAVAADYTTRSVVAAAGVLKSFLVATDRELRSNRARRASESYPWTVQDHKLTASVTVHEQAQWSLLRGFNQSSTHTSMDLLLTNTPIRSALLYLDMGSYSTEYLSGLASSCVLENAVFNTSFTTPKKPATPWFSTRLTAINTPLPLKNSPNSDTYVVSWHMPIIPDAPEVVTIRNAINVPRGNIQFNMQLTATVRTGTAACPNLPIVPLTVQPAYACADEYGFVPRVDALAPQYEKLASAAAPFEAEFMDYALADESFADAEFSDDADGEFALGDEFALEDDAAYSVDDAWDEAGDEAEAGFAFEDDLVDEDGVDEADFAIEDYLFGDEY